MEMFRGEFASRMGKVPADCKSTGTQVSYACLPEQTANLPERRYRMRVCWNRLQICRNDRLDRNLYTEFRIKSFVKKQKYLYLQPKTEMWRDLAACNHTKKC